MLKWHCMIIVVAGMLGLGRAASNLPELKSEFEATMRTAQVQQRENLKNLRQTYTDALVALEGQFQEKGAMQEMLVIREEKARFEQAGEIPAEALSATLPALRKAQDDWMQQLQQMQLAHAQRIASASEKYMQNLAGLQKALAGQNNSSEVEALKAETERLLGNNIIRDALALARPPKPVAEKAPPKKVEPAPVTTIPPLTAPVEVGGYKFYPLGKEPPLKDLKELRLEFPNTERKAAGVNYALTAKVSTDKSKMDVIKHDFDWMAKREEGRIQSIPRITIVGRNKEIPDGCKLVLQYVSRSTVYTSDLREERVEHIALPPLARGQAVVVSGQGLSLYKLDYQGSYNYRSRSGREFYGLIVSLFDANDKLIIQQCAPSSLAKLCTTTLPAEREQQRQGPPSREREF